jgi:hypothetical protein
MDQIHKLYLAGEIVGLAVASLITLSSVLWLIRRKLTGPASVFVPVLDIPKAEAQAAVEGWLHRCLVALDIFLNVVVLRGNQGETISAHSWRASNENHLWGKLMNKWLNGFQDNHGIKAASGDLERSSAEVSVLKKALGL